MAWRIALERRGGPVALALSRQKLPTLDRSEVAAADGALRGAYSLWQSGDGEPDLILLATGSEVHVALEAARSLDANVRVVSMPCWELFEEQPQEYRDEVLPPAVRARVSVEAGVSLGWERWIGDLGTSVSIERFGASAPGHDRAREARDDRRERRRARGRVAGARGVKVAVAFDHRGVQAPGRR